MIDYDAWGEKPYPEIDPDSEAYWEAAANEELVVQHCTQCDEHQFYPRSLCRHCWSNDLSMEQVSGDGSVYSYTVCHISGKEGYGDDTPYNFALVELDLPSDNASGSAVRLPTHIVDATAEDIHVGMRVEVKFAEISSEPTICLPVFAPIEG